MVQTLKDELAALLLQCRADRDLTLEDVAKALRLSKNAISQFEGGKTKLRRTNRLRLIEFLRKHGYFPKRAA